MWKNRESAKLREEKEIQDKEKADKKNKWIEKKHKRRVENRLKKQEKKLKTNYDIKIDNTEIIGEILNDNPILRQKKIICFDLYGTLIYRPHSHWKTKHFLKKFKIEPFKKFYNVIQTNKKEDVKAAYESVDGFKMNSRALRMLQKHTDEEVKNTKIYPESLAVLKKLKNSWYKLALISNLSQDFEAPLRKLIPEGTFDYEALSYEVWVMKPDQIIFNQIYDAAKKDSKAEGYELKKEDILMVWDSKKSDVDWAKNAWMDAILLKRKDKDLKETEKMSYDKEKQLITIQTLTDLLDILWIDY